MHKIYSDQNKYNFRDQLPYIIYSTIISSVIITIVKLIVLTDKAINTFKKSLLIIKKEEAEKKSKVLMITIKIKYIVFCILVIILTFVFWYYVACFCAVYKNTQIALIKDALITFAITLVYPFVVGLIPALMRVISLKDAAITGPSSLIVIILYYIAQSIVLLL